MKKKIYLLVALFMFMILTNSVKAYNSYKFGDKVTYKGTDYYVIKDSSIDENYVTLLRNKVLDKSYVEEFIDDNDVYFGVKYADCTEEEASSNSDNCITDYNDSTVKKVIDNWTNSEFTNDELVDVDGYKSRILSLSDISNYINACEDDGLQGAFQLIDDNTFFLNNDFLNEEDNLSDFGIGYHIYSYWIYSPETTYFIPFGKELIYPDTYYSHSFVRPVINLNKDVIDEQYNEKVCRTEMRTFEKYNKYNSGDIVRYKGEDYIVLYDSDTTMKYVTLLKHMALTAEEINRYNNGINYENIIGAINYTTNHNEAYYGCYENSNVKKIVDTWANDKFGNDVLFSSLLPYFDDDNNSYVFTELFGYNPIEVESVCPSYGGQCYDEVRDYNPLLPSPSWLDKNSVRFLHTESTPEWLYDSRYDYWLKTNNCYTNEEDMGPIPVMVRNGDIAFSNSIEAAIRPFVILPKTIIGLQNVYNTGDLVLYKGIEFYVLKDSPSSENDVVLLKKEPLTQNEIDNYSTGNTNTNTVPFDDSCNAFFGCTSNYDDSSVKRIVDNWMNDKFKEGDLIEVGRYKARLLQMKELIFYLGYTYDHGTTDEIIKYSENTPVEVYTPHQTSWTMTPFDDDNKKVYVFDEYVYGYHDYSSSQVRPVINLYKCVLEDGCEYFNEEVEICDDETIDDVPNKDEFVVFVENTLKNPNLLFIIISILFVISGMAILFIENKNAKKELKK